MRSSLRLFIKPLPISSIPSHSLRLPLKPVAAPNLQETSPTISKLLSKLSVTPPSEGEQVESDYAELPQDGRGLGGFRLQRGGGAPPSNLRVEEWVPKRKEFEGVGKKHRDLVSFFVRLRL